MSLYKDIVALRDRLAQLLEETEELAAQAAALEKHNTSLQERLAKGDFQQSGFDALKGIYADGYHICPASFGQVRDEDCIFCLDFLLNKGKRL